MKSDQVSSEEWRWVALFSSIIVIITLLPYAWALTVSDDVYQFLGIMFNPQDGATYISKIQQGVDGNWLFELRHTPEPHDGAALHFIYLLLGHVARMLGVSTIVVFHLARVVFSFFMFFSLYQLGASIWRRVRPRRWFFLLTSIGSGLGWFSLLFDNENLAPDLTVPEAFPLLASYTNAHFPLAIGSLALMTAVLFEAFRPGNDDAPTIDNGGFLLFGFSILLAIIAPPALIVIGGVVTSYTIIQALMKKEIPYHEARWTSMVILPGVPFAAYYYSVFRYNDMMSDFNAQNITETPNLLLVIAGLGILLFIGLPGMVRAVRNFEADGDRLMLIWFVFNFIAIYLPFFALQRRLFIGILIPIVYFAVRSIEDFWLDRIADRWRGIVFVGLAVLLLPSHLLTIGASLAFTVASREGGEDTGLLINTDYMDAFEWLEADGERNDVVLSAPIIGLWVPAETFLRPVYGHPFETVPAEERLDQVNAFYRGEDCDALFDEDLPFTINYVLWGEQEDEAGFVDAEDDNIEALFGDGVLAEDVENTRVPTADVCREAIEALADRQEVFGGVTIYVFN